MSCACHTVQGREGQHCLESERVANRGWLSIVVGGTRFLDAAPFGLAIIDPDTGSIAHQNPTMAVLAGRPLPDTVDALDELALLPRADGRRWSALWPTPDAEDRYLVTTARVAQPDDPTRELTVHAVELHALRGPGSVVVITATDFDNTFSHEDLELALNPPREIHVLCDLDLITLAADQRHLEFGIDPWAVVGSQAMLAGHPADVVNVTPKLRAVVRGDERETQYSIRVLGPAAAWTRVSVSISRFCGDDAMLLVTNTPEDTFQVPVDLSVLSPGERAVAQALLAGRRPSLIAADLGMSVHTVRHRMTTLFRMLGVDSQVELRRRYLVTGNPGS